MRIVIALCIGLVGGMEHSFPFSSFGGVMGGKHNHGHEYDAYR
jgi:hypothetical protein